MRKSLTIIPLLVLLTRCASIDPQEELVTISHTLRWRCKALDFGADPQTWRPRTIAADEGTVLLMFTIDKIVNNSPRARPFVFDPANLRVGEEDPNRTRPRAFNLPPDALEPAHRRLARIVAAGQVDAGGWLIIQYGTRPLPPENRPRTENELLTHLPFNLTTALTYDGPPGGQKVLMIASGAQPLTVSTENCNGNRLPQDERRLYPLK